jgi:hypothetical protein
MTDDTEAQRVLLAKLQGADDFYEETAKNFADAVHEYAENNHTENGDHLRSVAGARLEAAQQYVKALDELERTFLSPVDAGSRDDL